MSGRRVALALVLAAGAGVLWQTGAADGADRWLGAMNQPQPPPAAAQCPRRCTPQQIYRFARGAGFAPDAAATMTAVALAESGGDPRAHNPHGENSQGLWQINRWAHPEFARVDLYDPAQNARAAFGVSGGGGDVSPWTVTHGGSSARYVIYRAQAQAAAVAYGDGPGRGMWAGTSGYGDGGDRP